jgi:predicted DNA-binding transcriptional regulator YafY
MRYWALQFSEFIEVLEPESLRESLKSAGEAIANKYA